MTFWPLFYLVCAMVVVSIAAYVRENVKFWLAVLLLWSWTLANICVWRWGYGNAPDALALCELALAIATASIAYTYRSSVALLIVALFGMQETVQVGSRILGREGDYLFYAALNAIYFCQLLVVGGASGAAALQRLRSGAFWSGAHVHLGARRALK